jgi:S1-C subfamily serine protease
MGAFRLHYLGPMFLVGALLLAACSSDPADPAEISSSPTHVVAENGEPTESASERSLYSPPEDVETFIEQSSKAVHLIACGKTYGTGWIIDTASPPQVKPGREGALEGDNISLMVTVDHVIRPCIKDAEKPLRAWIGDEEMPLKIINWNRKSDIALLSIKSNLTGLQVDKRPGQGAWAVALGFPAYFEYPVTLVGSVIDATGEDVVLQMQSQPGSSGSPVLNSQGKVVGTLKEGFRDLEARNRPIGWSLANSTQVLCTYIFECGVTPLTEKSTRA